jgi:5,5'-dehydrodivanillate O-demethylase
MPPKGADIPARLLDKVHVYEVPWQDERGEFIVDNIDGQDMMAWITQGPIADRTNEHLGASDIGVALYRKMLQREIKKVEQGQDPIAVVREETRNRRIDLPNERKKHHNSDGFGSWIMRTHAAYSPIAPDLISIFEGKKVGAARLAG